MTKCWNLIEGFGPGIAGLVISLLGWVDDSLKSSLLSLSVAVVFASIALFVFQQTRDKSPD